MTRVLVVEDEPGIAFALEADLRTEGYGVTVTDNGNEALRLARSESFGLILLDVMLPGKDGFEVCRELRRSGVRTPIILLTAKAQEAEKVMGLELGADDYITKPFSPRELIARIKAHLRREEMDADPGALNLGPFQLDRGARRVFLNSRELTLTSTEFNLLEFFLTHPGRAYSREQLLEAVWGEQRYVTPRTVDVHVRRLREQIEEQAENPRFLTTVRGFGYRFEEGSP